MSYRCLNIIYIAPTILCPSCFFIFVKVHDIEFAPSLDMVVNETLPVLEEYLHAEKIKFIGVTGYPVSTLWECIQRSKTKLDMTLSYTRLSLIDNTLKEFLPKFQVPQHNLSQFHVTYLHLVVVEGVRNSKRCSKLHGVDDKRRSTRLAPCQSGYKRHMQ